MTAREQNVFSDLRDGDDTASATYA